MSQSNHPQLQVPLLEKGPAETSADDAGPIVEVTFHSFELSPDTPVEFEGDELDFLAGHKGFAKAHGLQYELEERLMSADFTEGRHVGRITDLVSLASDVGLDADAARRSLESSQSGAPPEAFAQIARQLRAVRREAREAAEAATA